MSDLRMLIREVLTEEIHALRAQLGGAEQTPVVHELVAVASDYDLNSFARHMLSVADDPAKRAEFLAGRLQFTLNGASNAAPHSIPPAVVPAPPAPMVTAHTPSSAPQPMRNTQLAQQNSVRQAFDRGILTEKDVEKLPQETRALTLGRSVRLTPLASDELRRRNIKIERTAA